MAVIGRCHLCFAGSLAVIGCAAPAEAAWSPAVPIPGSAGGPVLAVNNRGEVAAAWSDARETASGKRRRSLAVVRAAIGRPGAGALKTHTILSAPDRAVAAVTVTVDRFGEMTVAWAEQLLGGPRKGLRRVRAAYRTPAGRWSSVQIVGASSAFANVAPRVASAPDGTVALSYYAGSARPRGMTLAWRTRGRPFAARRALGGDFLTDPTLAFDGAGTMYLAGTRRCDGTSQAVFYRATRARRRQPDAWLIGDAPVRSVGLGITGRGSAVIAWLASSCNAVENRLGLPIGLTVTGTKIGAAQHLDPSVASDLTVAGGDVSWASWPSGTGPARLLTTRLAPGQPPPAAQAAPGGWIPVAADASGDRLVRQVTATTAVRDPAGSLPAGGSSVEPAPLSLSGWPWTAGSAAASYGRGLALLTVSYATGAPALATATWVP